jgi:hypothetical protein
LKAMAANAGLAIVLNDAGLPMRAHMINDAYRHYATMQAAERAKGSPGERAEWAAGVAAACEHVLTAFAGGHDGYRDRLQHNLARGFPADSGETQSDYREIRLLLMRGFGPEWREHRINGDLGDPWELLMLGTPRFLDFAKAIAMLAQRAEAEFLDEKGTRGGKRKDDLRRNLMMHLCAAYRDLFGELPTHSDRHGAHALRETFPEGPAIDWFGDLLHRLEGGHPTADAVKNWILWGKAELAEAAERLARDDAEFPE